MPVNKRTYNTRRIKRDYPYTLREISELFEVHIRSVRNWVNEGLPLIDTIRPYMVHGSELISFIKKKQSKRKHKCKPNEFYCLKCSVPKTPLNSTIDIKFITSTKLSLEGVCSCCGTKIFRFGLVKNLPEYTKTFVVQKMQGGHIVDTTNPTLMCHFERTNKQ